MPESHRYLSLLEDENSLVSVNCFKFFAVILLQGTSNIKM